MESFDKVLISLLGCALLWFQATGAEAELPKRPVTASIEIIPPRNAAGAKLDHAADPSNAAVWLVPEDEPSAQRLSGSLVQAAVQVIQRNKAFEPHVLIVQVGTKVSFPNKDPFFHNIFSLFDGKRFDLGLYEAGSTRTVQFDRPGISYLFCNIHPEMSAVIITVDTPYFGLSDASGRVTISGVPNGTYQLRVWYERSNADDLKLLTREVTIASASRDLGTLHVVENLRFTPVHKNKYGEDYLPPSTPGYIPK